MKLRKMVGRVWDWEEVSARDSVRSVEFSSWGASDLTGLGSFFSSGLFWFESWALSPEAGVIFTDLAGFGSFLDLVERVDVFEF